jgi:SSS family solute:Na+ symporter
MIREILPAGLTGIMFAALFGAVMSSLDSMLNSAATIFTIDIYQRHIRHGEASSKRIVRVGRIATAVLVVVGCLWAPIVARAGSVFEYIQMFWGFISPGIVAAFLFGLFWQKVPPVAASGGMILGIPVYGLLLWMLPDVAFLHHMMITFGVISLFIFAVTSMRPMAVPNAAPEPPAIELESSRGAKLAGIGVVVATALLYLRFW